MATLYLQIIEAALSGQPRSMENTALVTARFSMLKEMKESGDQDVTKEQTIINELAVTAAQWISAQTQVIKDLETKVDKITSLQTNNQGRQHRITESRGAANLKVFSGDKKELNEWIENSSFSSQ